MKGHGVRRIGWLTMAMLAGAAAAGPAQAAPGFRARAVGHVFQCGARVIEFDRDGGATLSSRGADAVLPATSVRWSSDRVRLRFAKPAPKLTLDVFGTTVTAHGADGSSGPCITVR